MPSLVPLCEFRADLRQPAAEVGAGPFGTRNIVDVAGGTVTGERLRGRVLPSGGDWVLVGSDGVGRLDVRATFESHDGALVYAQYHGVLVMNEKVLAALGGGAPTDFGDTYFMTAPRFETGDPRYAWLNRVVAIGQGRLVRGAVEYRVFEVTN